MDLPKYNGNIHPDEWVNDIQKYLKLKNNNYSINDYLEIAKTLVDTNISLPTEIDTIEKLRNALKEDISFTVFKKFEDIIVKESNLIKDESIVALKHIATGKYLSSFENLHYRTGSKFQLIFAGSPAVPDPNSLWKIKFGKELATYNNTSIKLQHIKSSNKFLGIYYGGYKGYYGYYKSPSNNYTEVSCNSTNHISNSSKYWNDNWKFNDSKLESRQGYLKSNDIINISVKKLYDDRGDYTPNGPVEFLRSHDIKFTIGNDTFQEVVCHNERLGGNDEWCIELIKQHIWTIDTK
ncbi:hypothetical protein GLOIN_2v1543763 [Rhizophagus irregularis DAOM 181602=DAOM 197198]|nr:hypothetical protein GLOIN_2v1543763 [Rhizophagus irregularis DAOM 181602=DAOM 197198]